ncbi:MAG: hypothetical protein HY912_14875 [Desulfomonile tiedjei]|uniref:Uncharacterized protein n=1 Tax=Desulfomonile tiedjei TaxID=2358 RepID=A0A9D6V3F3_9BACT|nr:hypothetical protein [Desulfomonile tiedjei]
MRLFTIAIVVCLFSLPVSILGDTVTIRDSSGNIVRTEKTEGNVTTVRDPQGKLIEKRIHHSNRVEVRDPSGRLLRSETIR